MPKDATSSGGPPGSTSPGVLSGNVVTTPQLSQGVSPSPQAGSPSVGSGNGATTVFSYSGKLQTFTVPTTGTYDIVAEGAQGGFSDSESIPGKGAEVGGDFQLTAGEMLSIVAGGQGQQANFSGGGGGGSFVYPANALGQPLLAAGGGGGAGAISAPGGDGQAGTTGSNAANGPSGIPWGAWEVPTARAVAAAMASLNVMTDIQTPQVAAAADTLRRERTGLAATRAPARVLAASRC